MNNSLFINRRQKISEFCEDGSMLLLFANSDKDIVFVQNKNFFYLTGLNIPEAILMITKEDGKVKSEIFIEQTIPERIVWDGEKMCPEEVKSISGIETVHFLGNFETVLNGKLSAYNREPVRHIYVEGDAINIDAPLTRPLHLAANLRKRYPAVSFGYLSSVLNPLRMKKDEWEVEQLKKAIGLTWKGLERIFKAPLVGKYEYQVEAILNFEMVNENVRTWGFKPIIASGINATTLHYCENNQIINKNDLLLMDVGASYNGYSADITRTIPVSSKFSKRQKAVYSEVLQVQKTIIESIKPGVTLKELNDKTVELISEALIRLILIEDKKDYRKYYMHSISHHLGLNTHDVHVLAPLEEGCVITVEPGIYIPEESIGVRIEDDILVTQDGYENLSKDIPKEVEELEEMRTLANKK